MLPSIAILATYAASDCCQTMNNGCFKSCVYRSGFLAACSLRVFGISQWSDHSIIPYIAI